MLIGMHQHSQKISSFTVHRVYLGLSKEGGGSEEEDKDDQFDAIEWGLLHLISITPWKLTYKALWIGKLFGRIQATKEGDLRNHLIQRSLLSTKNHIGKNKRCNKTCALCQIQPNLTLILFTTYI